MRIKISAAIAIFMLSVCSCATRHSQLPPPNFAFQWGNSVTELATPDATFVRAFEESRYAIESSGTTAYEYPGFDRANHSPETSQEFLVFNTTQYRHDEHPANTIQKSNYRLRLGPIETGSDGIVQATVCQSFMIDGLFMDSAPTILKYRRAGTAPPSIAGGPASRPSRDVFGGWYAVEMDTGNGFEINNPFCRSPVLWPKVGGRGLGPSTPGWP